jgi:hypothetical protein
MLQHCEALAAGQSVSHLSSFILYAIPQSARLRQNPPHLAPVFPAQGVRASSGTLRQLGGQRRDAGQST